MRAGSKVTSTLNLIGRKVSVRRSTNLSLEGIEGIVVDETKNMLMLRRASGAIIRVPKAVCSFEVVVNGKRYLIDGKHLLGRIEKRLTGV